MSTPHVEAKSDPVPKKTALKAVAKRVEAVAAPVPATTDTAAILGMIERIMVDPNASVERANQAFEFYQRVQADQAKRAFSAAMVDAKAKFTPIVKRHLVEYGEDNRDKKKTSYKHEDLADISAMVDPVLAEFGLSFRHRATSNLNEPIKVTCVIEHRLGYSEETTLTAGSDGSGGKNAIQAIGSTLTYLQRYTLRIALGLATGRDDDGKAAGGAPEDNETISEDQLTELIALADEVGADKAKFCAWAKIESFAEIRKCKFAEAKKAIEAKRHSK